MAAVSTTLRKILLVEDNPDDALLFKESLQKERPEKFQVIHVQKLSQALQYLKVESCDVILLDLNLPDSAGFNTFSHVRIVAEKIPVIIFSGSLEKGLSIMPSLKQGEDFIYKGLSSGAELVRSIENAIRGRGLNNGSTD